LTDSQHWPAVQFSPLVQLTHLQWSNVKTNSLPMKQREPAVAKINTVNNEQTKKLLSYKERHS